MAIKRVRCPCGGDPVCRLCNGTKFYEYEPGPRVDPTGAGRRPSGTGRGPGGADPGFPRSGGALDVIWKALFGA